ncbi:MAG: CxxxxCH/CxxCH domain-containing protein [Ignavibacteriales bacterium]|nr:hypothetical protein [Ignavibacteriaceae bacterium]MBW7871996.1 CxxxxCH/CxxCH domain-containing protein [Ignavibacteria bacterium]MBZ0197390.1 CxxxxCH/CxxCH domain-containing protein [Ignavibacteriaceae bacterium]MCZ2144091.1 CxxxxCH/CxxCH domain-containing protein [Ignavibacteriales bacterium]WKZ72910.1 MAG: CxxxxCH/CxxCH domain-containing protein [Ignavibacteriaceae bacterium]
MKKIYFYSALLTVSVAFLIAGCSKINDNIPVNAQPVAHKPGYAEHGVPGNHAADIIAQKYILKSCTHCHGADYGGGIIGEAGNCRKCHSAPAGPEACYVCHGDYKNPTVYAPKQGAHYPHLYTNSISLRSRCSSCHIYPTSYYAPGHIDNPDGKAEVTFGSISKTVTNEPSTANYRSDLPLFTPAPVFSETDGCSSTYCHGHFKNGNLTNVVKWTDGADGKKCGTCHGDPVTGNPKPKGTHPQGAFADDCSICHNTTTYNAANNTWKVDSTNVHVDGKLRYRGADIDF